MKRLFVNSGLIIASMLVGMLLIEGITRLFIGLPSPYVSKPGIIVLDQRGFWSLEPGYKGEMDNAIDFQNKTVTINANGTRKVDCQGETDPHRQNVYLIGDSQTFGWGLSDAETWASKVQCRLNEQQNGGYHLFNLGVPGMQADQYVQRGISQVLPLVKKNDVVVVSITWNDLVGFYSSNEWVSRELKAAGLKVKETDTGPLLVTADEEAPNRDAVSPSLKPLAFMATSPLPRLAPATWRYDFYQKYGFFVPSFESPQALLASLNYLSAAYRLVWSRAKLLFYKLRPADSFFKKVPANSYRFNFLSLKALSARLENRGARVVIQFLPNRVFFDDFYYSSYSKNGAVFPARDYFWHIGKPFCDSLHLTCVNRFDDLKTGVRDAHTFAYDGHYNPAAAERIASALAADVLALAPSSK